MRLFHTIRKAKFLSKTSILIKPQDFHAIFTPNFFDNFSRENKVVNSYTVQNHNIFTSYSPKKKSTIFSGNQSGIFGQKMKVLNSVKMQLFVLTFNQMNATPAGSVDLLAQQFGEISPNLCTKSRFKILSIKINF